MQQLGRCSNSWHSLLHTHNMVHEPETNSSMASRDLDGGSPALEDKIDAAPCPTTQQSLEKGWDQDRLNWDQWERGLYPDSLLRSLQDPSLKVYKAKDTTL